MDVSTKMLYYWNAMLGLLAVLASLAFTYGAWLLMVKSRRRVARNGRLERLPVSDLSNIRYMLALSEIVN